MGTISGTASSAHDDAALDPGEEALLDERAASLAASPPPSGEKGIRILTFALGASRFGVELTWVQQVVAGPSLAVIPGGPSAFVGLLGLLGQPVVVADLRPLLGLPGERVAPAAVVVIDGPPAPLGLAAHDLPRVETVPAAMMLPPPPELTDPSGMVAGVAGDATLLAVRALLADPRLMAGPT